MNREKEHGVAFGRGKAAKILRKRTSAAPRGLVERGALMKGKAIKAKAGISEGRGAESPSDPTGHERGKNSPQKGP